jgi:hypothetical protein
MKINKKHITNNISAITYEITIDREDVIYTEYYNENNQIIDSSLKDCNNDIFEFLDPSVFPALLSNIQDYLEKTKKLDISS